MAGESPSYTPPEALPPMPDGSGTAIVRVPDAPIVRAGEKSLPPKALGKIPDGSGTAIVPVPDAVVLKDPAAELPVPAPEPEVTPEALPPASEVTPLEAPPVPGAPASAEVKRSAEAEQRIQSLDLVINQYAAGAGSEALQAENKYSSELAGRGIRGIFKGFGRRLVTKALIGGGIGAAFGGIVGAGAGVVGALGSEVGVLGTRAMRELTRKPDELERLQQIQAEKQNALADIARRAIEARLGDDPAEANRLRLEFVELSSQMSDPQVAALEQSYEQNKDRADKLWGRAETVMSLAGGILSGHAAMEAFATQLKARIAHAGFTMHGQGIGEITKHSAALQEIGKQGHHVASMGNGDLVYSFRPGEPAAMEEALKHAPWLKDAFANHFHLSAPNMHLAADQLTEAGKQFAAEFNRIVGVKFAERLAGILTGIGLASLVGDRVGRRERPQEPAQPSLSWLNKQRDALRNDLKGGGTPPDGPDGPGGPDDPDQPNPEKKERIPVGSTWELQPGDLAEIVKNNTGRELPPNCKFKVTGQDEDGKVSLVITDNDVEGNPVMVENADTGGESLLGWKGEYALPVDYFLANFRPAVEAVEETEKEDDGYNWEPVEQAGEMPLMVDKGDEYEVDGKKVVLTEIQQGTPKNTEEDEDAAETEPGKLKYKLTFTDEAGNSVITEAMTTDELLDKFITLSAAEKADFIKALFDAAADAEAEETGDEEEAGVKTEPEAVDSRDGGEMIPARDGEGSESTPTAGDEISEDTPASAELTESEKLARVREIFGDSFNIDVQLDKDRHIDLTDHPVAIEIRNKVGALGLNLKGWSGKIANRDRIPTGTPVSLKIRIGEDNSRIVQDRGESIAEVDMVVASFGEDKRVTENKVSERWERGGYFFPVGDEDSVALDRFNAEARKGKVIVRDKSNNLFGVHFADVSEGRQGMIDVFELDSDTLRPASEKNRRISINELSDWYVRTEATAPVAPAEPESEPVLDNPEPSEPTPPEVEQPVEPSTYERNAELNGINIRLESGPVVPVEPEANVKMRNPAGKVATVQIQTVSIPSGELTDESMVGLSFIKGPKPFSLSLKDLRERLTT